MNKKLSMIGLIATIAVSCTNNVYGNENLACAVNGGTLEAKYPADRSFSDLAITQFAYGSCNKPRKVSQKFWDVMLEKEPQLMLLLGDQHYTNSNEARAH